MTLRFSIIVATFNRRDMTLHALDNIQTQAWPLVEIIVVDGGSTDGTVEALRERSDIIFIEGPDRGVYDAFNKGIARATGDIVGILNTDDLYDPGTLSAVAAAFSEHPDVHAVCGTALLIENQTEVARYSDPADKMIASPRTTFLGSCIPNARFFRREAMEKIGAFKVDFRFVADRDWLTRWYEAGFSTYPLDHIVYRYLQHSESLTFDPDRKRQKAIYVELLHLARSWRDNQTARPETQKTALALEGRCIGRLAALSLREGNTRDAFSLLFRENERLSAQPLFALFHAVIDRMLHR